MSETITLYKFLESYCKNNNPKSYLEIGTQEGNSLRRVAENSESLNDIYVCDTWQGKYGGSNRGSHSHIEEMLKDLNYTNNITYLDGSSTIKIPELHSSHFKYFDLILVDGDHSANGAMIDLENVIPLCKDGGTILFHDITHPAHSFLEGVFDEFVNKYKDIIKNVSKIPDDTGIGIINL